MSFDLVVKSTSSWSIFHKDETSSFLIKSLSISFHAEEAGLTFRFFKVQL